MSIHRGAPVGPLIFGTSQVGLGSIDSLPENGLEERGVVHAKAFCNYPLSTETRGLLRAAGPRSMRQRAMTYDPRRPPMYLCMYVCMYVYIIQIYVYTHIHVYTYVGMCMYVHVLHMHYVSTCVYICAYTYIHIHVYVSVHTYVCFYLCAFAFPCRTPSSPFTRKSQKR